MPGALALPVGQPLTARRMSGAAVARPAVTAPLRGWGPRRRPAVAGRRRAAPTTAILTVQLSNGDVAVDEVEALRPPPLPTTQAVLLEGGHTCRCCRRRARSPPAARLAVIHSSARLPVQALGGRAGRATPGGARCAARCRTWPSWASPTCEPRVAVGSHVPARQLGAGRCCPTSVQAVPSPTECPARCRLPCLQLAAAPKLQRVQ